MTLAKAAPPDWAAFFAHATRMPVEYVRWKLRKAATNGTLDNENGPSRIVASESGRSLTTTTVGSR